MAEKRKRLLKPKSLIALGVILLLLPVLNYLAISFRFGIFLLKPVAILRTLTPVEMFLLISPPIIGIGILQVKKIGWWSFLAYAILLVSHNAFRSVGDLKNFYNLNALVEAALAFGALIFIARKDISAPYFKMYPRGWRLQKRKPSVMDVKVDGKIRKTRDVSSSGLYLDWKNCSLKLNEEVTLELDMDKNPMKLKAGVVRIDSDGAGLAFRGLLDQGKLSYLRSLI